ncbi:hypothetical protein MKW98_004836 [Papaver atlanticum]|uniref:Uncharacterized protein n=1 Tax=Papaver atlanticum TaxID=357466 RepID=A0AAD4SHE5_9MAGN|nr:hypothetical protein MKW98_004836 [Papaver atlanticum]
MLERENFVKLFRSKFVLLEIRFQRSAQRLKILTYREIQWLLRSSIQYACVPDKGRTADWNIMKFADIPPEKIRVLNNQVW